MKAVIKKIWDGLDRWDRGFIITLTYLFFVLSALMTFGGLLSVILAKLSKVLGV